MFIYGTNFFYAFLGLDDCGKCLACFMDELEVTFPGGWVGGWLESDKYAILV